MKAKLVKESLETSTQFGYYDMANALDVMQTAVPALREQKMHFSYDGYSNFLKVLADNEEQAKIAEHIILDIAEGDKGEQYGGEDDDAAEIVIIK